MTPSILVTGTAKYVEFAAGHVLINGQLLEIKEAWRITDDELTGSPAPNANYGDYYVFLRPNKKVMEAYYQQDWEYVIRSATAGGAAPAELPDELCIGRIEKRDVSGVTQLTAVELNRGKSLIDTKDVSDGAITSAKLAPGATVTDPNVAYLNVANTFTATGQKISPAASHAYVEMRAPAGYVPYVDYWRGGSMKWQTGVDNAMGTDAFYWYGAGAYRLGLSTDSLRVPIGFRAEGWPATNAGGLGLELGVSAGEGIVQAYHRTNATYHNIRHYSATNMFQPQTALVNNTASTYGIRLLSASASEVLGIGADGSNAHIQSWGGRPLILNNNGNQVTTGSSFRVANGQFINPGNTGTALSLGNGTNVSYGIMEFWNTAGSARRAHMSQDGSGLYLDSGWFRNQASGYGLYNDATGGYFYNDGTYWNVARGGGTPDAIRFRNGYGGNVSGYVYHDTSGFGLLNGGGNWMLLGGGSYNGGQNSYISMRCSGTQSLYVGTGGAYTENPNGGYLQAYRAWGGTDGNAVWLDATPNGLPGQPSGAVYPCIRWNGSYGYYSAGGLYSAWMSASGTWGVGSDPVLKREFKVSTRGVLDRLLTVPVYNYKWREEYGERNEGQLGVLSPEFYASFPELDLAQNYRPHGTTRFITHADQLGVLNAAVQELAVESRHENKNIEARLDTLERTILTLAAEVGALK